MYFILHLKRVLILISICLFSTVSTYANLSDDPDPQALFVDRVFITSVFEYPTYVAIAKDSLSPKKTSDKNCQLSLAIASSKPRGTLPALFRTLKEIAVSGGLRFGGWLLQIIFQKDNYKDPFSLRN